VIGRRPLSPDFRIRQARAEETAQTPGSHLEIQEGMSVSRVAERRMLRV